MNTLVKQSLLCAWGLATGRGTKLVDGPAWNSLLPCDASQSPGSCQAYWQVYRLGKSSYRDRMVTSQNVGVNEASFDAESTAGTRQILFSTSRNAASNVSKPWACTGTTSLKRERQSTKEQQGRWGEYHSPKSHSIPFDIALPGSQIGEHQQSKRLIKAHQ